MHSAGRSAHRLQFEASTHTYRLDGEIIPGVTTVLKETKLIDFSFIPQDILQTAARRGTRVHSALHYYALETLDMSSVDPIDAGYVVAGIRFHEESRLVIANVEQRVFDPVRRYAGTFDLEAVIGNDLWMLDYKTGVILPGHRLQLAAYLNTRLGPRRYRYGALQLKADGTYRLHECGRSGILRDASFYHDIQTFFTALASVHAVAEQAVSA